jgi:hypothetical protein
MGPFIPFKFTNFPRSFISAKIKQFLDKEQNFLALAVIVKVTLNIATQKTAIQIKQEIASLSLVQNVALCNFKTDKNVLSH